ncbi:hypothetical protein K469DRAFT_787156 [Zopfia rhizophila CBS 207.26]|uniref:Uncharacterized protein n=1 Tax=Zopfia rhizophila CBS 207.26 TaxID=1314779 RepID=A0A6A6DYC5_9PEZI|nr:hypothetical protein K469DRAFT_787156 [Zopfia rhizophila CBS 207.26]
MQLDQYMAARGSDFELLLPQAKLAGVKMKIFLALPLANARTATNIFTAPKNSSSIVSRFVTQAGEDRAFLRRQCELHSYRIINRWKKKTRKKREPLFLQAEPDLCKEERIIAHHSYRNLAWDDARKLRKTYLLPNLNIENLKKHPEILFGLIHNRSAYSPECWIPFDCQGTSAGRVIGHLDVDFNAGCVVMYGSRFGEILPWDGDQMHRSDLPGFPRARLVLEAQATLLQFLRTVAEILLENLSTDDPPSSTKWVEMKHPGFKNNGDAAYWSQYVYQSFSAPPQLDINALVAQANTKVDAAEDHLWLLQMEPSYLKRYPRSVNEAEATRFEYNGEGVMSIAYKQPVKTSELFDNDPLFWCVMQLQREPDEPRRFSYAMLFDFLDEHLAGARLQERARLDEILYENLSDFAAILEMFTAIRFACPQNTYHHIEQVMA